MLTIAAWLWGDSYGEHYVRKLASAVKRNLKQPHRFICITDRHRHLPGIEQVQFQDKQGLTKIPGCFSRLQLFNPAFQELCCIKPGDRVANLDLDMVVTGPLDLLFLRDDDFTILQGINTTNPCPYNGSIWMLRAGARPDVWSDFSLENYHDIGVRYHAFPDDQGWFDYMMPGAGAWGPETGVYGFKKQGWPSGDDLPPNACIVAFPGWRDPAKFSHLKWVAENWR